MRRKPSISIHMSRSLSAIADSETAVTKGDGGVEAEISLTKQVAAGASQEGLRHGGQQPHVKGERKDAEKTINHAVKKPDGREEMYPSIIEVAEQVESTVGTTFAPWLPKHCADGN